MLDILNELGQRTGTQDVFTRRGMSLFVRAVALDIADILFQMNGVYFVLLSKLADFVGNNPTELGLCANTLWADAEADANSDALFWDSVNSRKRTVKEALEYLNAKIDGAV